MYRLMIITDRKLVRRALGDTVAQALAGGADAVQLREKDLPPNELFALAEELRDITKSAGAALIVNHRVDVALAVGAEEVQLGWRSMAVADARKLGGDALKIGVSCHSLADVQRAESDGADYVILGPVFFTPSKEGLVEPLGVEALRAVVQAVKIPVIAVGGITPDNAEKVRATGVAGVAVISAVMKAEDPCEAARLLK